MSLLQRSQDHEVHSRLLPLHYIEEGSWASPGLSSCPTITNHLVYISISRQQRNNAQQCARLTPGHLVVARTCGGAWLNGRISKKMEAMEFKKSQVDLSLSLSGVVVILFCFGVQCLTGIRVDRNCLSK